MNKRRIYTLILIVILSFAIYKIFICDRRADMILINGNIYTGNDANPFAQAIAIKDKNIIALGSSADISQKYKSNNVIDLRGKTVIPGLIDSHAHMFGFGQMLNSIMLVGITSVEEIAEKIQEKAASTPAGEWIYGRGWDQTLWADKSFPTKDILDQVSPDNPVILGRIDGHAIWVNQKAMDVAGISASTPDPDGGKILRDQKNNPTGIFIDNATELIRKIFPPPSDLETENCILLAAKECVKAGLTEVHDMGLNSQTIRVYKKLADEKKLPLRIYGAIDAPSDTWNEMYKNGPTIGYGDGMLTIRAVKMYADGALGSRGAALIEDYSDDPVNRGLTLLSDSEMEKIGTQAIEHGFQVCTHAIGDRANHVVLNLYEKLIAKSKKSDLRLRIEHAQVLDPTDIPRFKALGVLPSMQPIHATSDMDWAAARLGAQRVKGAYAWKSLINTGAIIPAGSDFPNDIMQPLWGFYAEITRTDQDGNPIGGWYPQECMSREEALKSYTLWAAYSSFQENKRGTVEIVKLADLTILSKDIMKISPEAILTTEVEYTIVGGNIVFKK
ncbi:MAG: amidohydrolase [Bacteroidetes bacterium]|nr:amidohydrolase [Bacteroidota bacterium]